MQTMGKRARGEGSISKRPNGTFMAQYRFEGKRKTVYAKTQREVLEKLKKINADIEKGTYIEKNNITLENWLSEWLELYAKQRVKQSTYISYETYIKAHLIPVLGDIPLQSCKVDTFQRFLVEKAKSGSVKCKNTGLSEKTIRNMRNMLNNAMQQAVVNEIIQKNPIIGVQTAPIRKKEMRVLSLPEQAALIKAAKNSIIPATFGIIFTIFTGVRIGELLGLKWCDIDFNEKTVHIRRTLNRLKKYDATNDESRTTEIVIGDTKTSNSDRTIFLINDLFNDLVNYRQKLLTLGIFKTEEDMEDAYVFVQNDGQFFEPKTYQDLFTRTVKAAGIKKANFHALRHTFATRCIEKGMDVLVVSKFLGHADVGFTLNKYGHSLKEHKRESILKLEGTYLETCSI